MDTEFLNTYNTKFDLIRELYSDTPYITEDDTKNSVIYKYDSCILRIRTDEESEKNKIKELLFDSVVKMA